MSRYGYLEVFQRVPWNSRYRESTVVWYVDIITLESWPRGYNIILNVYFCICPVSGPRAVVLAPDEAEGQYGNPKVNTTGRGSVTSSM